MLFGLRDGNIRIGEWCLIKELNILRQGGYLMTTVGLKDFPTEVELQELNKNMTIKIGNWKPPQRPQWVKEVMRTPGHTKVQLLLLLILTISSVSSTVLLMSRTEGSTSGVSISGSLELREVKREK